MPALARVFEAALAGGGAKSINFQELAADLAEITFKFPFRIPPYFAVPAILVLPDIPWFINSLFVVDNPCDLRAGGHRSGGQPRVRHRGRGLSLHLQETHDGRVAQAQGGLQIHGQQSAPPS